MKRILKLPPYQLILLSFITIILVGAVLLMLPISTIDGNPRGFLESLFTATSAACVTGLVVNNINTTYNLFGKSIILILIQLGGLGVLTFSSMLILLVSKKMGYYTKKVLSEDLNYNIVTEIPTYLKKVSLVVFGIEFIGAVLLFFQYIREYSIEKAIYYSIFHSVSAFCNAGFSLYRTSLEVFVSNTWVNIVICILIILGGIGFAAILDIYNVKTGIRRRISASTKMAITFSAFLIVTGMILIFLVEFNNSNSLGELGFFSKILASFFQSVTTRTAGFNTIPLDSLKMPTIIVFLFLMFIGASPGSTGGGIKTTTFGIIAIGVLSSITGKEHIEYRKRRISWNIFNKACAIVLISVLYILLTIFLITLFDSDKSFLSLMFELVSAFGTVGLSMGITADLSVYTKIIIIITMFIGRIGPLTIMFALSKKKIKTGKYRYPEETILIG
ncbi:TrkH family potassium uptake protein [Oceanivirga salmonicida]|uniref:TrkH family potassium uptake protein n=1 Tax=Oceanivirga salmonicida TaxID=1769291 RepID=UPI00082FA2B4|nr:TrkH family potassium uptake protein [Oceanivirga salmonicida]